MPKIPKSGATRAAASSSPPPDTRIKVIVGNARVEWTLVEPGLHSRFRPYIFLAGGKEIDEVVMIDVANHLIHINGAGWEEIGRAIWEAESLTDTGRTIDGEFYHSAAAAAQGGAK